MIRYPLRRALLTCLPALLQTASPATAETTRLADNTEVLTDWQQRAGGGQRAELVAQDDGGTHIEWKGGITLDQYNNRASGGTLLNPALNGNFYKLQLQGDLRGISSGGNLSYFQFSALQSNDRAIQRDPMLLQSAQVGWAGEGYQVALGDVAPDFSPLGTSLGLRGVLAQKQIGQSLISVSAGTLVPSWNSLVEPTQRTEYLRNVAAAKFDLPLGSATRAFASLQSYADDPASLDSGLSALAPASGRTGTVGFSHQQGQLTVTGEAGLSQWSETGQAGQRDNAYMLDLNYAGQGYSLRGGHHKLGVYYTSLSAQAAPGIVETYLNGNWQAKSWLTLQGDLRRSKNSVGGGTLVNAINTDSASFSESLTFGDGRPGLSLLLNQSLSVGKNANASTNRNSGYGAALNYTQPVWNTALGYTLRAVENQASPSTSGQIDTWTWLLGRAFSDNLNDPTWRADLQLTLGLQNQTLDSGSSTRTLQYGFGVAASQLGWGTLNASVTLGTVKPTGGGADLRNYDYQLEATHPFKNGNNFKVYLRESRLFSGDPSLSNSTRTFGAQLALVF
jgi:hypothetical protein